MKHKKLKIAICVVIIIIILIIAKISFDSNKIELLSIKSEKELEKRYDYNYNTVSDLIKTIATLPWSIISAMDKSIAGVTPHSRRNSSRHEFRKQS